MVERIILCRRGSIGLRLRAFLLGLALLGVTREARAEEPAPARAWTELALISSVRGPLGPAALACAVLPLPGLAVGMAFGYSKSQSIWGHDDDPRIAFFARYHVLSLSHFRFGLGVLYSEGSYYLPGHAYWHRGARLDGMASVDWVIGNLSLRLEGGAGRMMADPAYDSHAPAGSTPSWFPNLQLAVAVRPGERPAETASPPPLSRNILRILAAGTPVVAVSTGCETDCTYDAKYTFAVEGDWLHQVSPHWRLGVGGRLDVGRGVTGDGKGPDHTAVVAFVPILLSPFYRWDQTGEELELSLGLGLSFGHTTVDMGGLGGEISLSYSRPVTGTVSLVVGMAARVLLSSQRNGLGAYASLPLRLGVRW